MAQFVFAADNRDGTYTNPIIDADYSDPDVIRIGDDFYLTASSFNSVPGLPILHSKDLVNYTNRESKSAKCGSGLLKGSKHNHRKARNSLSARAGFAQKSEIPPTAVGGWLRSFLIEGARIGLRIPPTAVGGLFKSFLRNKLKYPPTAVGRITVRFSMAIFCCAGVSPGKPPSAGERAEALRGKEKGCDTMEKLKAAGAFTKVEAGYSGVTHAFVGSAFFSVPVDAKQTAMQAVALCYIDLEKRNQPGLVIIHNGYSGKRIGSFDFASELKME